MITRRRTTVLLGMPLVLPSLARAQGFPQDRPIRAVVNFPPGGTVDTVTVARMPFDTLADFVPVGFVGGAPVLMAAHPSSPFRTLADVIAAGRVGEGPHYGTIGNGSTGHLMMAQLQTLTGARFTHVPFRGGGPAVQAALGGQVPLVITSTVAVGPQVQAGNLRGVALSGAERSSAHPTVPRVAEQGFPGFSADSWVGVFAPARTPDSAVIRINAELGAVLGDAHPPAPDRGRHDAARHGPGGVRPIRGERVPPLGRGGAGAQHHRGLTALSGDGAPRYRKPRCVAPSAPCCSSSRRCSPSSRPECGSWSQAARTSSPRRSCRCRPSRRGSPTGPRPNAASDCCASIPRMPMPTRWRGR